MPIFMGVSHSNTFDGICPKLDNPFANIYFYQIDNLFGHIAIII